MNNDTINQETHDYQRAYKACYPCRKRKSRCEKDQPWTPGAPCKRCKREMRDCVFPTERADSRKTTAAKSRRPEQTDNVVDANASEAPFQTHSNFVQDVSESPASATLPASSGGGASLGGFSDSMMRTVLSNGNDALAALFEPVGEGHGPSQNRAAGGSTFAATMNGSVRKDMPTIEDVKKWPAHRLWNLCRFVKQGWFSPNEGLFFVEK